MPETETNLAHNINDLIGNPPGWLLKSGLTAMAIVVVLVITMAAFIRYPDKITSKGIMTSKTPPLKHEARVDGLVDSIFVVANQLVKRRDTLLYINNQAHLSDIAKLAAFIEAFKQVDDIAGYANLNFPQRLTVGDLQSSYASFELNFSEYQLFLNGQSTATEIELLKHELSSLVQRRNILSRQQEITSKELELNVKEFERTKVLHKEKVVSEADFEKANAEFLQFKKQAVDAEDGLIESRLEEERLKQQIFKLVESKSIEINERLFKLKELASVLKLQISEWTKKYLVIAEINGHISFNNDVIEHQMITAGQIVAYLIPVTSRLNTKLVRAQFPVSGIGKIKAGDRAIIRVDGYPDKEYGSIDSEVKSITKVPLETVEGDLQYELNFNLPEDTIKTNYNITIPFKPNTSVTVDVITEDKSLLQRVFNQFLSLIKNQS